MLSGISIFCFAASYTVALILEITRLWFRSGIRGAFILIFAGAGLLAHTLFLGYLGYLSQQNSVAPLSSAGEYYLLGAWILAAIYLYVTLALPKTPSGVFLLPLVLLLIAAGNSSSFEPFPTDHAAQVWGRTHGIFLLLGYLAVAFGFVVGLMYLIQAKRLKQKLPTNSRLKLPALEWLERANHRATVWAPVLVGAGFVSGIILNVVRSGEIPWSDPVVWRSAAMVVWLTGAAMFAGWYRPAQYGRKVAYLTVASFLFLLVSIIVGFAFPTAHKVEAGTPTGIFSLSRDKILHASKRWTGEDRGEGDDELAAPAHGTLALARTLSPVATDRIESRSWGEETGQTAGHSNSNRTSSVDRRVLVNHEARR